jgi:NAD(P) transhydrogenase subunit alpha
MEREMIAGVPKETYSGERRVALVPATLASLSRAGLEVVVEKSAGEAAGYPDAAYESKGARIAGSRAELFGEADVILQVRAHGANPGGRTDLDLVRRGQIVIGFFEPLTSLDAAREMARTGATLFAMELMPRITRAQSMDALSSMATLAGYKAVLIAAGHLTKIFPMMMTAAGTVSPAKVFVVGAGVAGLQAVATSRRLGAVVEAYDVRPAVKEQIQSLGAKFLEIEMESKEAEDEGGYARELGEEFYRRQREAMTRVVAESDAVITTAAVPGKKAPVLVTAEMVAGMSPGSVIVDLAAERGGNCQLTRPGETVVEKGVTILGPLNMPAGIPFHASQMYSKNISTFLLHMVKEGKVRPDTSDQIVRETMVCRDGEVVHPGILEAMRAAQAAAGASH